MLQKDPLNRPTASQCLQHKFFKMTDNEFYPKAFKINIIDTENSQEQKEIEIEEHQQKNL